MLVVLLVDIGVVVVVLVEAFWAGLLYTDVFEYDVELIKAGSFVEFDEVALIVLLLVIF